MKTDFTADTSACLMASMLRMEEAFTYVRYGDGAIECIFELGRGRTCDGEVYTKELGFQLHKSWGSINRRLSCAPQSGHQVYIGDWLSAAFEGRYETAYEREWTLLSDYIAPTSILLHFEALLLHRESEPLLDFYRAARDDKRPKIYIGPHVGTAHMLGASWINVPINPSDGLFAHINDLYSRISTHPPFSVVYWSAGMAGSILIAKLQREHPDRTYINLGSAMDPLFRGRSRSQQLSPERARQFMKEFFK